MAVFVRVMTISKFICVCVWAVCARRPARRLDDGTEKRHKCEYCGYTTNNVGNFRMHMLSE